MDWAPWTHDSFVSSRHGGEADDRDDGLNAARGGLIAALVGSFAWTLILLSVHRLLS